MSRFSAYRLSKTAGLRWHGADGLHKVNKPEELITGQGVNVKAPHVRVRQMMLYPLHFEATVSIEALQL